MFFLICQYVNYWTFYLWPIPICLGIHKLLFLVKRTKQHCVCSLPLQCNTSYAVSSKPAEMQFTSGYSYQSVSRVGPGSGIRLSKYFRPISGLDAKLFCNNQCPDTFLWWLAFVVFTTVISVGEVNVIYLQLILIANTAAFFCFLLGLDSHSFWKGNHGKKLARHGIKTMTNKPAFHAYSAIVYSFVIFSLFLDKHYIPQYYHWLTS